MDNLKGYPSITSDKGYGGFSAQAIDSLEFKTKTTYSSPYSQNNFNTNRVDERSRVSILEDNRSSASFDLLEIDVSKNHGGSGKLGKSNLKKE
jgi:hypothetical protein